MNQLDVFPATEAWRRGEVPEPWVVAWRVGKELVSCVDDIDVVEAHRDCCKPGHLYSDKRYLVAIGHYEEIKPYWAPTSHYRAPSLIIHEQATYETNNEVDALMKLQEWDRLVFWREE